MIRPRRKKRLAEFSPNQNFLSLALLWTVFITGLIISLKYGLPGGFAYLGLWAVSYAVIYAGTCRYCVYYGKKCPVPLEGSCVHKFFEKKDSGFGWFQILWAAFVYILRIILPAIIIIHEELAVWGGAYAGFLALFWVIHLRVTGCPNCINVECPLNPDCINNSSSRG